MKLVRKRNKVVEDFLSCGPLEIDNLQSYYPTLRYIERVPYSKWNAISLEHLLVSVDDHIENKGRVTISKDTEETKPVDFFVKCTPLFDTTKYMQGTYVSNKVSHWLPSKTNCQEETIIKIQNTRNTAYVDSLCSILLGKLKESGKCIHFGSVYGVYNGVYSGHTEDISEEYDDIKDQVWFKESLLSKKIRIVEKEKDNKNDLSKGDLNKDFEEIHFDTIETDVASVQCESEGGNNIQFEHLPVQIVITEKFRMTFDDLLKQEWNSVIETSMFSKSHVKKYVLHIRKLICMNRLKAWVFQICSALAIANNYLDFVHNDLHVQNIMAEPTDKVNLYYKHNSIFYKVPTYGYIIKIIDFGRATFRYDGRLFIGDVFEQDGEAGGQYHYDLDSSDSSDSDSSSDTTTSSDSYLFDEYADYDKQTGMNVLPKSSFDLCRFACSLLEDIHDVWGDISDYPVGELLLSWVHDDNERNILGIEGFNLYKHISRFVSHTVPSDQLKSDAMKVFMIDPVSSDEIQDEIYTI